MFLFITLTFFVPNIYFPCFSFIFCVHHVHVKPSLNDEVGKSLGESKNVNLSFRKSHKEAKKNQRNVLAS